MKSMQGNRGVRGVAAGVVLASLGFSAPEALADDSFSSPSGPLGANLSFDSSRRTRLHGELSFHTQSQAGASLSLFDATLGFGQKLTDHLELEATLPISGSVLSASAVNFNDPSFAETTVTVDQFGVGNLALQVNFFAKPSDFVRWKVGGGVAAGPWNQRNGGTTAEGATVLVSRLALFGYEAPWLTYPTFVHVFVPARVELGTNVRFTADGSLNVAIPTGAVEGGVQLQLAPGVAFWVSDRVDLGARVLLSVDSIEVLGDSTQLSFEPYARLDFDSAFLATRFTMQLDDPLGFSFDTGGLWGLHLALGGTF